jgi:hypothetical protein
MIEEELKKLTEKPWTEEERAIIQKLVDGFLYYRKLIPKSFKTDMISALQMCNSLKDKLDILVEKQAQSTIEISETKTIKIKLCTKCESALEEV